MSVGFRAGAMLFFSGSWPGVSEHARYQSAVETGLTAEAEGFHDLWIGEHHYLGRSNPAAIGLAAYLLGRTTRVRVGTAVTLLPLHSPVHVAEQASLLDHLSGGRFDLGVGRGEATVDYEVMSSVRHLDEAMPEALDLVLGSFGGAVRSESELYGFRAVSPRPLPVTQPHPPVLVACEADATLELAARHGVPCMFFLSAAHDEVTVAQRARRHAAIAHEHGHHGPWPHVLLVHAQVGDTDEDAARAVRGPLQESLRSRMDEYVWLRDSWRQRLDPVPHVESVLAQHAVGSPATCIDRLTRIVERSGVGRVALVVESAEARAAVRENVQRLGREVLPAVRARFSAVDETASAGGAREAPGGAWAAAG